MITKTANKIDDLFDNLGPGERPSMEQIDAAIRDVVGDSSNSADINDLNEKVKASRQSTHDALKDSMDHIKPSPMPAKSTPFWKKSKFWKPVGGVALGLGALGLAGAYGYNRMLNNRDAEWKENNNDYQYGTEP